MQRLLLTTALLLVGQGGATPIKSALKDLSAKCIAENNAPLGSFKLLGGRSVLSDESEQCYLECIYRGLGLINDQSLDVTVAKRLADKRYKNNNDLDQAYKVIDSCAQVRALSGVKCGLGVSVRRCILEFGKMNNFYLQQ
ncbi:uncharacterized protein LOC106663425 [Cimex lectularius]|uniref:Odorant binding protein n=1 Tax=Cimex lectularius TaxID=79782 RepID=A0A8I6REF3_CIMLE|nr:uncharacterized protein LOC106663425 [Cimex lectularius]